MRRPRVLLPLAIALVASGAGCTRRAETVVGQTPVGVSEPPRPPPSTPEPVPPARAGGESRGGFACGKKQCRIGEESCCTAGEVSLCVANAPPDPPTSGQLLGTQIEACTKPPLDGVGEIARCRGSSHCGGAELCCNESLFSGASAIICKAALPSEVACDYGEVCTAELPCRSPGAVCVKGQCRKSASVDCGGTPCDLTTHTCRVTDAAKPALECKSDAEIAAAGFMGPVADVTCASHADCLPGERCRLALGRSFCQRADDGMTALMCDPARACPKDFCAAVGLPNRKPVCKRAPDDWHATCGCV